VRDCQLLWHNLSRPEQPIRGKRVDFSRNYPRREQALRRLLKFVSYRNSLRASIREFATIAVILRGWERNFGFNASLRRAIHVRGSCGPHRDIGGDNTADIARNSYPNQRVRSLDARIATPVKISRSPYSRVASREDAEPSRTTLVPYMRIANAYSDDSKDLFFTRCLRKDRATTHLIFPLEFLVHLRIQLKRF
jgi:hypothetical protein